MRESKAITRTSTAAARCAVVLGSLSQKVSDRWRKIHELPKSAMRLKGAVPRIHHMHAIQWHKKRMTNYKGRRGDGKVSAYGLRTCACLQAVAAGSRRRQAAG